MWTVNLLIQQSGSLTLYTVSTTFDSSKPCIITIAVSRIVPSAATSYDYKFNNARCATKVLINLSCYCRFRPFISCYKTDGETDCAKLYDSLSQSFRDIKALLDLKVSLNTSATGAKL